MTYRLWVIIDADQTNGAWVLHSPCAVLLRRRFRYRTSIAATLRRAIGARDSDCIAP
jgi:hypothetical protein